MEQRKPSECVSSLIVDHLKIHLGYDLVGQEYSCCNVSCSPKKIVCIFFRSSINVIIDSCTVGEN